MELGNSADELLANLNPAISSDDIHSVVGTQQLCAGQLSGSEATQGTHAEEDHEGTEFSTMKPLLTIAANGIVNPFIHEAILRNIWIVCPAPGLTNLHQY